MNLEELNVYRLSMELGEEIWSLVEKWNYFQKDTIGKQLVSAIDSVAANISEGFGRFHYNDAKRFYYYSRGSLFETKTWITKSYNRKIIDKERYVEIQTTIVDLSVKLNNFIKSVGKDGNWNRNNG